MAKEGSRPPVYPLSVPATSGFLTLLKFRDLPLP